MEASDAAYETAITVRYRDLDPMGQVHNGVVLQYVEEARVRYFRDVLDADITALNGAIASQGVDYHAPIQYGSSVAVRYRVTDNGETSLTMGFEVAADGTVAAAGSVVHVVLDDQDAPAPVPEAWVERIRAFEDSGV